MHPEDSTRLRSKLEQRLRTIIDTLPVFIGYWNEDLRCEFANEAYRKAFGIPPELIVGMTMRDVLGEEGFHESEPYAKRALAGLPQQFERVIKHSDALTTYFEVRFIPDLCPTENRCGFFVLVSDVTTARNVQLALEAAIAKLANNDYGDYLTGLANRRKFASCGTVAIETLRGGDEGFGVLMIDVDHFSAVNDQYGYDVGDKLLCEIAAVLKVQQRNHRDVAARINGPTFAMLCFGEVDTELLSVVAESVRTSIAGAKTAQTDASLKLTASIGVTIALSTDTRWEDIYARAEAALYEAKLRGRDCIAVG